MIHACPEALEEKLNGKRNVLHYAIAEGVYIDVIRYLTLQHPALSSDVDSFHAIPLHLAATYPSSSMCVLNHLLNIYPVGAKAKDYKAQTPLHRACRARASIDKVQALIEACPEVLFWKDWIRTTPLGWAERMDHSLSESDPLVIELLELVECILTITNHSNGDDDNKDRAQQILLEQANTLVVYDWHLQKTYNFYLCWIFTWDYCPGYFLFLVWKRNSVIMQ